MKYFPGVIGGHCAMPNIELLARSCDSPLLDAIRDSNAQKVAGERASVPSVSG